MDPQLETADEAATDAPAGFGARVRALRKARNLTLQELSRRCGLAPSTLSKAENGKISPTYDNLLRLAKGLGVDLAELLRQTPPSPAATTGRFDVTRAAGRGRQPAGVYVYEPLSMGLTRKLMDPTFVTVTARSVAEFPELIRHPGEEFVFVVSGAVEVHTEFYAPVRLEAGDSVYFDARMGHAYVSVGDEDATIINVCAGGAAPPSA